MKRRFEKLGEDDAVHFTVDAALLQELGERLIGRAYIALAELLKNAYDADSANCAVEFGDDRITITDDGHGISEEEFRAFWLRVGTTHKADKRLSRQLGRAMTGSKGLGRLSVQFLAHEIEMESTSDPNKESIYAYVDWRSVDSGNNLQSVDVLWTKHREPPEYPEKHPTGTRIVLTGLRSEWDADTIKSLGEEVWMLRSPFESSRSTLEDRGPGDFHVNLDAPKIEGSKAAFDEMRNALFDNWRARIRGKVRKGIKTRCASVSVEFKSDYPKDASGERKFTETFSIPVKGDTPPAIDKTDFQILIFKPEGVQKKGVKVKDLREYLRRFGNVSLYDAGFRLPHYGSEEDETGQDWLNIAIDQGRRITASALLPERLKSSGRYLLDLPAPGRIFGTVDINTNHERQSAERRDAPPGTWLQLQSGRDRLSSNVAYKQLRDLVRASLDFYASRYRMLADQAAERRVQRDSPSEKFSVVKQLLIENKRHLPAPLHEELLYGVSAAEKSAKFQEDAIEQRAALLAPLATAGMAALALNHEIARERQVLKSASRKLSSLARKHNIVELTQVVSSFEDAYRRLGSLQDLFAPLLSEEDKMATERHPVKPVVREVVHSMKVLMPGTQFDFSAIPRDIHLPLGSFADWSALLQNILSNAWNAMIDAPKSLVSFDAGQSSRGKAWLRVSDTGAGLGIPIEDSGVLFQPFERRIKVSDARRSLAIGGQGLGLTIVRMIASRLHIEVGFIEANEGFSTTIQLSWRGLAN